MNDLKEIKKRILEEDKIEFLLIKMECEKIKFRGNRYEAQLPRKFNSDNPRSVQVYLNESLSCRIRSRGISGGFDIFGLVSYIVFDVYSEEGWNDNLYKSKKWICSLLGYNDFQNKEVIIKDDPLKWLKDIRKKRKKELEIIENEIIDDSILSNFVMVPHINYINEGIDYKTQKDFQIGYDIFMKRIIWPIHNQYGDIVSIKGRTIYTDYKERGIFKFVYYFRFNKSIEWYNWHRALYYILENKEVIIFEGDKSCWLATQWGYPNCVAIGGDDISPYQVKMISDLGLDIKIIIAMDKDKSVNDIKKQGKKFGTARSVFALWDNNGLLSSENKESPTDKGKTIFELLYKECTKYRIK
jgi:DNA primase